MKVTGIDIFANEVIAYVAEHIYCRRVGLSLDRFNHPVHKLARQIANVIVDGKPQLVELINKLRQRISLTPHYRKIKLAWDDDGGFVLDG